VGMRRAWLIVLVAVLSPGVGNVFADKDGDSKAIAFVQYARAPDDSLTVNLRGCRSVTNGQVVRSVHTSRGEKPVRRIKRLTGRRTSSRRAAGPASLTPRSRATQAGTVTTVLAIWGAAVSTLLGIVKLVEFWRDRPRLRILVQAHINEDEPYPLLSIIVSNRGRQPITIVEAGFLVDADVTMTLERTGREVTGQNKLRIDGGQIQPVTPGGVARFQMLFKTLPPMVHVDFPLRAYVIDSNRRTTYGGASPLFRRFVGSWRLPEDADPKLLEPSPEPIMPRPVYRRWQIWKPKGTRPPLWRSRGR
jgi:hypothetical protein